MYHTLMAPLTVLSWLDYVDSPWQVVLSRSRKAGLALADILASSAHGDRPVRLFATSVGCFGEQRHLNRW